MSSSILPFSPAAARALVSYDWPLNVRELRQCIASSVALSGSPAVDVVHLPEVVANVAAPIEEEGSEDDDAEDGALRSALLQQLRVHKGNISQVARAMGKARSQVQRWLRRLMIDAEAFRDPL